MFDTDEGPQCNHEAIVLVEGIDGRISRIGDSEVVGVTLLSSFGGVKVPIGNRARLGCGQCCVKWLTC